MFESSDESRHLVQVGDYWVEQRVTVDGRVVDQGVILVSGAEVARAVIEWYGREGALQMCPAIPTPSIAGVDLIMVAIGRDAYYSFQVQDGGKRLGVTAMRVPGAVCPTAGVPASLSTVVMADPEPVEAGWTARVSVQAADSAAMLRLLREGAARCLRSHPDAHGTWVVSRDGRTGAEARAADGKSHPIQTCLMLELAPTPVPVTIELAPPVATGGRVQVTGADSDTKTRVAAAADKCLTHHPSVSGALDLSAGDPMEWADRAVVERRVRGTEAALFVGCLAGALASSPPETPLTLTIAPATP
jgi:hypothetical protein